MIAEPNTIAQEILTFGNGDDPEFNNWPQTIAEAAECWADVIGVTANQVVPASTTQAPARVAFINTFLTMSIESQNGYQVFAQALMAFATQLASGMTPAGFTGAPPPQPFIFNMQGLLSNSSYEEALRFATDLVLWFKTGTATNISSGTTINWT